MSGRLQQRVRFLDTPAGKVAYSVVGSGPVLVCDTGWVSHLEKQLEDPGFAGFFSTLAERLTVVRYDKAGCGLSDRTNFSLRFEHQVAALLAVAARFGPEPISLFGASQGAQVAIGAAAASPELVRRLVLFGPCVTGADLAPEPVRASLVSLVRAHGGLGSRTLAEILEPGATTAELTRTADIHRSAASAEVAADLLAVHYATDLREVLPNVQAPTLVIHREADRASKFGLGREVAALIPDATLLSQPGNAHLFWKEHPEAVANAIVEFVAISSTDARVQLSHREQEVAALVAEGLTSQEIGERLHIAQRTAETHVDNIRQKLGFRSRSQIATWVTAQGMERRTT